MLSLQRPKPLVKGDGIAIVSPASTPDRRRVESAMRALESLGYHCRVFGDIYARTGYLAGGDIERAQSLVAALASPDVAAVLPTRGGYGCSRLLALIDWERLQHCAPKVLVGYSDITALHVALQQRSGWVTFHGPHPMDIWGNVDGVCEVSAASFLSAITDSHSACRMVYRWNRELGDPVVREGRASGPIVGGNLAVMAALIGTPYEVDTRGKLLMLEDVDEPPYRIDRYLCQLHLAGKLADAAGVLLGYFTRSEPESGQPIASIQDVVAHYMSALTCPVMQGLPVGHERPNLTIPLGLTATLDTQNLCLTIDGYSERRSSQDGL